MKRGIQFLSGSYRQSDETKISKNWLSKTPLTIAIVTGASITDKVINRVIENVLKLRQET